MAWLMAAEGSIPQMAPPTLAVPEFQVQKLIAIYNKICLDERLSCGLRAMWTDAVELQSLDAKLAAEAEAEVCALRHYVHSNGSGRDVSTLRGDLMAETCGYCHERRSSGSGGSSSSSDHNHYGEQRSGFSAMCSASENIKRDTNTHSERWRRSPITRNSESRNDSADECPAESTRCSPSLCTTSRCRDNGRRVGQTGAVSWESNGQYCEGLAKIDSHSSDTELRCCGNSIPRSREAAPTSDDLTSACTVSQYGNSCQSTSTTNSPEAPLSISQRKRNIRVFADGVFDLSHSGHFNALRQARALGDQLVVGVNSDADIWRMKGSRPIYNEDERAEILRGCKWVDEVVIGTPYCVEIDLINRLQCDFVAHGDDMAITVDGDDCYAEPRAAGKLKNFKRTEGISSTTLVRRLLLATQNIEVPVSVESPKTIQRFIEESLCSNNASQQSLMSTKRLLQFIGQSKQPNPGDRIVYVDGSFDVFHVGHVRILQKAKELGDYLVVGIHDDATVHRVKGRGFPVMNLLERALNVLALRVVDEVIIGAPWTITEYLIKAFSIDVVVRGTRIDRGNEDDEVGGVDPMGDPYEVPKSMGIYREVESSSSLTTREIILRIVANRSALMSTICTRSQKEELHWAGKSLKGKAAIQEI